jgi:hypothetical protein
MLRDRRRSQKALRKRNHSAAATSANGVDDSASGHANTNADAKHPATAAFANPESNSANDTDSAES